MHIEYRRIYENDYLTRLYRCSDLGMQNFRHAISCARYDHRPKKPARLHDKVRICEFFKDKNEANSSNG